jgi:hypothetical protein
MSKTMKRIVVAAGAAAFVAAVSAPALRAEETIIEKRTEESHSYKVEPAPPVVVERRTTVEAVPAPPAGVVTEHTTVERVAPPVVVEKRTTVESVPAPVIERRTTETIHTDD